jgi:3-methyladenine DNA glycosylase AlkC
MAEPFKNFINAELIEHAGRALHRAAPDFDAEAFSARICPRLPQLELKARAMLVADALEQLLPADFARAATIVEHTLAPVLPTDGETSHPPHAEHGLRGWILWPVGEFAARRGVAHPERALQLMHALTQRFTAEFAIRPLIVAHPALVYATLAAWTRDPSAHVRRLVSEGTRPRLPWGLQLKTVVADPTPSWPLLAALMDDDSAYVRRSVANHLNDIAKDHPLLVIAWTERYLHGASPARRALLRHATRTLVKQGHRQALQLWGLGDPFEGSAHCTVLPHALSVGESLHMALELRSHADTPQRLVIDYAVHHRRHNGETSPKVFKGWTTTLPARGALSLTRRHSMKSVTTRRYYAGMHIIEIQVNGAVVATVPFLLTTPSERCVDNGFVLPDA